MIVEPDGRVWVCEPTNQFGGSPRPFPKGTRVAGWSRQATAAREVFEETGLLVEVGAFLIDCGRRHSVTRFFLARRIGGSPSAMGWETQALWLVPMAQLWTYAPVGYDAPVIDIVLTRSGRASPGTDGRLAIEDARRGGEPPMISVQGDGLE